MRVPPFFLKPAALIYTKKRANLYVGFHSQGGTELNFSVQVPGICPLNWLQLPLRGAILGPPARPPTRPGEGGVKWLWSSTEGGQSHVVPCVAQ